jgi:Flp pilus assembly protein CpaB
MKKSSNLIMAIGLAVFLAGAAATFVVVRDKGDNKAAGGSSTVLFAAKAIPAGTTGGNVVDQGFVRSRSVKASARPAGALSDPSQLVGKTAVRTVPEGAVLTDDQFSVPQTELGTVRIPNGKVALALQLGWVPGVAGFVAPGDHIDIDGVVKDGPGAPAARLIMQNTEVLHVGGASGGGVGGAMQAQSQATSTPGANSTFLLAVTPQEAERLVYLTSLQQLYLSLVSKDAPAVGSTPGTGAGDALKPLF